jgi:hypothetical protein
VAISALVCAHARHCVVQAFLIDGMESQSQAKVGSALQVFFNLDALNRVRTCRACGGWVGFATAKHMHELGKGDALWMQAEGGRRCRFYLICTHPTG